MTDAVIAEADTDAVEKRKPAQPDEFGSPIRRSTASACTAWNAPNDCQ
jgi:hypothetical protein